MTPATAPATLPAPAAAIEPQGAPAAATDAGAAALPGEPAAQLSFAQLLAVGLAAADPAGLADVDSALDPAAAVQPAATDAAATALAALGLPAALAAALSPPAQAQPGTAAQVSAEAPATRPGQATDAAAAMVMAATPAAHTDPTEPCAAATDPGKTTRSLPQDLAEGSRFALELKTRSIEDPALQERKNAEPALAAQALEPMRAPHAANATKPAAVAGLPSPVASAEWSRDLGDTVRWMAGAKQSVAELRLNPPELGPLQIVLTLGGDDQRQASVAFVSAHGEVRQAIEAALPQLRDMLAGSGIHLGDASVNAHGAHADPHSQAGQRDGGHATEPLPEPRVSASASAGIARLRDGAGLIDIFA